MEAFLPVEDVLVRSPAPDTLVWRGLDGLVHAVGSLASTSLAELLASRAALSTVVEDARALGELTRGLGPDFTQGEWLPLVEKIHDVTSQVHGELVVFYRSARAQAPSPHLLEGVRGACAAIMALREEATLLAGRAAWAD